MATNYDENDVFDLVIARRRVEEVMARDGLDAEERAALDALDVPINSIGHRVRAWGALLSYMRNGLTKHTLYRGKDAGITVVVNAEHQVIDFVAHPVTA